MFFSFCLGKMLQTFDILTLQRFEVLKPQVRRIPSNILDASKLIDFQNRRFFCSGEKTSWLFSEPTIFLLFIICSTLYVYIYLSKILTGSLPALKFGYNNNPFKQIH